MTINALEVRFSELKSQAEAIEASKTYRAREYFPGDEIEIDLLLGWKVKVRNLIVKACGRDSEHYRQFEETEKPVSYRSTYKEFQQLRAVFLAAKEDFEGGYINSIRNLVQAELYSDQLDQASELLLAKYITPAAVVAGVVLETTLRQLCIDRDLPIGKLDGMNATLTKAGCYNLLVQKRITALAQIRNDAAHGKSDQFEKKDVLDMISYVRDFISRYL